ncbi:hypothetical protein KJ590_00510, partial [Patescibacteria group bacterium]|nr:hypothetical protein [Patescibacteria group bacterium]
ISLRITDYLKIYLILPITNEFNSSPQRGVAPTGLYALTSSLKKRRGSLSFMKERVGVSYTLHS